LAKIKRFFDKLFYDIYFYTFLFSFSSRNKIEITTAKIVIKKNCTYALIYPITGAKLPDLASHQVVLELNLNSTNAAITSVPF
jgi:hypothetical protein